MRALAIRAIARAVAAAAFVAIFFAAVVALVDVEIGRGPTDVVFVSAAVGTGMEVSGHGCAPFVKTLQVLATFRARFRFFYDLGATVITKSKNVLL
jgi:hypothetical protein